MPQKTHSMLRNFNTKASYVIAIYLCYSKDVHFTIGVFRAYVCTVSMYQGLF